jgi:hypothetical protein
MTTESNAAPGVAADTATPEPIANTQPEVATPESESTEQAQQTDADAESGDGADKSIKRMERRLGRVTGKYYEAEARAKQLEAELSQYKQTQPEAERQFKPEELEGLISKQAEQIADARHVDRRGAEISTELFKLVGSPDVVKDLIDTITEEAGPFINPRTGKWTALGEAVDDSKNPAELIKYLGKNPDVAASLHGLTDARLGRRIAAIEAQMAKPEPKRSNAPPPLEPVKAGGKVQKAPSEMSDKEFAEYRRAQIAKRR